MRASDKKVVNEVFRLEAWMFPRGLVPLRCIDEIVVDA